MFLGLLPYSELAYINPIYNASSRIRILEKKNIILYLLRNCNKFKQIKKKKEENYAIC